MNSREREREREKKREREEEERQRQNIWLNCFEDLCNVERKEMGVLVICGIRAVELRHMSVDVFIRIDAGVALTSYVIQANLCPVLA